MPGSRRATPCSGSCWRSSTTTTSATSSMSRHSSRRPPSPTSTGPSTPRPRTRWPRRARSPRPSSPSRAPTWRLRSAPACARGGRQRRRRNGSRAKAQVKRPNAPGPRRRGADRQAAAREGGPQRPLLVRERQEVQVLPWRRLRGPRPRLPGTSPPSWWRSGPGWPRPSAISGWTSCEARRSELEAEAARPDLWDDPDQRPSRHQGARAGVSRPRPAGRAAHRPGRRPGPPELTEESAAAGAPDASLEAELVETVDALGTRLARPRAAVALLG